MKGDGIGRDGDGIKQSTEFYDMAVGDCDGNALIESDAAGEPFFIGRDFPPIPPFPEIAEEAKFSVNLEKSQQLIDGEVNNKQQLEGDEFEALSDGMGHDGELNSKQDDEFEALEDLIREGIDDDVKENEVRARFGVLCTSIGMKEGDHNLLFEVFRKTVEGTGFGGGARASGAPPWAPPQA